MCSGIGRVTIYQHQRNPESIHRLAEESIHQREMVGTGDWWITYPEIHDQHVDFLTYQVGYWQKEIRETPPNIFIEIYIFSRRYDLGKDLQTPLIKIRAI